MPQDDQVTSARDAFVDCPRRNDAFPSLEMAEKHFEVLQTLLKSLQQIDQLRQNSSYGAGTDSLPLAITRDKRRFNPCL